jgi:hypothetical protein
MSNVESFSDDDFFDFFLCCVAEHSMPKLVPTIDAHGQPLDLFKVSWNAGMAEESGHYPLISSPAQAVNYFIFYGKNTGLIGYLSFYPVQI